MPRFRCSAAARIDAAQSAGGGTHRPRSRAAVEPAQVGCVGSSGPTPALLKGGAVACIVVGGVRCPSGESLHSANDRDSLVGPGGCRRRRPACRDRCPRCLCGGAGIIRYDGDCSGCGTQRSTAGKRSPWLSLRGGRHRASWTGYRRPGSEPSGDYHAGRARSGSGAAWHWPLGPPTQAVAAWAVPMRRPCTTTARRHAGSEATGGLGPAGRPERDLHVVRTRLGRLDQLGRQRHPALLVGLRLRFP